MIERAKNSSFLHQKVQEAICVELKGEAQKEVYFSSIKRRADVAFYPKRYIFEVQLSFIELYPLKARIEDYFNLGWKSFWLLPKKDFAREVFKREALYLERRNLILYFSEQERGEFYFYDKREKKISLMDL